jgi:hypothetical protein
VRGRDLAADALPDQVLREGIQHRLEVAVAGQLVGEVVALQLEEIGDVAVVRHRHAHREVEPERLHVGVLAAAHRGVAHVANGHVAAQAAHVLEFEHLAHEAEALLRLELLAEGDDASGVLAAVLDCDEASENVTEDIAAFGAEDRDEAAHGVELPARTGRRGR